MNKLTSEPKVTAGEESDKVASRYSTFCTVCKTNVQLANAKFVRLATRMAVIEGNCAACDTKLIKGKIMPSSGKNPLRKSKRKSNKKRLSVYTLPKKSPS